MTPVEQSNFRFWIAVAAGTLLGADLMLFGNFLPGRLVMLICGLMLFWGVMAAMKL